MKEFKKGDKVESSLEGPGEVVHVFNSTETGYPVMAFFDNGHYFRYTSDGQLYKNGTVTLYHAEKPKYFKSPLETGIKTSLILAVCGVVGIIYAAYRAVIYFFF